MKETKLIAPCGMNCTICSAYLARENDLKKTGIHRKYCTGCRPSKKHCNLKENCLLLKENKIKYCYECPDFPCPRLKRLDKRYREKYHMSMIENNKRIKETGIDKFIEEQNEKWGCPKCDGMISCHNGLCFKCDIEKLKAKKLKYCWEDK